MGLNLLKSLLPDRSIPVRVWRGPFRGARIVMNPRYSLRKMFGLYERELNGWLEQVLRRVNRVLDVGANDGYFTFGCAAAFHRLGVKAEITGLEPHTEQVQVLRASIAYMERPGIRIEIIDQFAGREVREGVTTLDALPTVDRRNTLVKIDVEGAELDVLDGAQSWMDVSNFFVIEVHKREYIQEIIHRFERRRMVLTLINHIKGGVIGGDPWRSEENWWLVSDLARTDS